MTLKDLKDAYKKAKESESEVFILQGREILTSYAKYLIEYLSEVKKLADNQNITFVKSD